MTNRDNFRNWFAAQIERLSSDRDAGFVIALISFPLLERYLRQTTKAVPKSPAFQQGLLTFLPELGDEKSAQLFWTTYRHGLLHNLTLSRETHGLTHDTRIVEVHSGGRVWLNPVLFAQRILSRIEADFETFEGGNPLPAVSVYGRVPDFSNASPYVMGTAVPRRRDADEDA